MGLVTCLGGWGGRANLSPAVGLICHRHQRLHISIFHVTLSVSRKTGCGTPGPGGLALGLSSFKAGLYGPTNLVWIFSLTICLWSLVAN